MAKTEFILIGSKSMIKNISNSHPIFSLKISKLNKFMSVKLSGLKLTSNCLGKSNAIKMTAKTAK